jgi:molybdate transport system substrate-binding protein
MRTCLRPIATAIATVIVLNATLTSADEIRVLSSVGIRTVVEDLAPRFEKTTKHTVRTVFDISTTVKGKIEGGEPFDVVIITPPQVDDLIMKGLVAPLSKTDVARVGLALMIKAGARKPDVSSVDAFKKSLLAAKSIAYAATGASGVAFLATIKKLDIAEQVKTRPAATADEISASVLSGASDLAVLPVSEILGVKGAEVGGVFPKDVQTIVVMTAGVSTKARSKAANEFISFLMSPANNDVVKEKGMER